MDEHQGNCPYCGTGPMWETPGDPEWLTMWACGTATSDDANGQIGQSDMCRINELEAANARLTSLLAATAGECELARTWQRAVQHAELSPGQFIAAAKDVGRKYHAVKQALDAALAAHGTTLGELAKGGGE